MQQLQAQVEQLTDLLRDVKATTDEILRPIHGQQQAAVLAAMETIQHVYDTYGADHSVGVTALDWSRLSGLEQPLKEQHRQIIRELCAYADKLHFTTMEQAKESHRVDADRVVELFDLDKYVLQGLGRYYELMLRTKNARGELTLGDVEECRTILREYIEALEAVRTELLDADTEPANRSNLRRVLDRDGTFSGVFGGALKDHQRRSAAIAARSAIQEHVKAIRMGKLEIQGPHVDGRLPK